MDSSGSMMRRDEGGRKNPSSLLDLEASSETKRDQYILVGSGLCDGGGLWKRYELNAVTPARFAYCADACDEKDECVGFDSGNSGCSLYTQKAVAVGSWPNVVFKNWNAFDGVGDHDAWPATPYDLTVTPSSDTSHGSAYGVEHDFKCFRKTSYKPVESYYRALQDIHNQDGACSAGTTSAGYRMHSGTLESCTDACNIRDECIGFDVGTAADAAANQTGGHSTCYLYTQKAVVNTQVSHGFGGFEKKGSWEGVEEVAGHNKEFLTSPSGLSVAAHEHHHDRYRGTAKCYVKTHWVSLSSYYMELGKHTCTGDGGPWKHYSMSGGSMEQCKAKCDTKDECVGIDFAGTDCRLYTSAKVTGWDGVTGGDDGIAGVGVHDKFAPDSFSLSPDRTTAANEGTTCMVKTHSQSQRKFRNIRANGADDDGTK